MCKWFGHKEDCLEILEQGYCIHAHNEEIRDIRYKCEENPDIGDEKIEVLLNKNGAIEDKETIIYRQRLLRLYPDPPTESDLIQLRYVKERKEGKKIDFDKIGEKLRSEEGAQKKSSLTNK